MQHSIRTCVLASLALLSPAAAHAQTIWDLYHQSAAIAAADGQQEDSFGQAVSLSGDTLAVAVPFDDVGSNGDQGSVRMFGNYRVWNQTRSIGSPALASAVGSAQAGDRLLVGNPAFAQADDVIDASQKPLTFVGLEPMTLGSTARTENRFSSPPLRLRIICRNSVTTAEVAAPDSCVSL